MMTTNMLTLSILQIKVSNKHRVAHNRMCVGYQAVSVDCTLVHTQLSYDFMHKEKSAKVVRCNNLMGIIFNEWSQYSHNFAFSQK